MPIAMILRTREKKTISLPKWQSAYIRKQNKLSHLTWIDKLVGLFWVSHDCVTTSAEPGRTELLAVFNRLRYSFTIVLAVCIVLAVFTYSEEFVRLDNSFKDRWFPQEINPFTFLNLNNRRVSPIILFHNQINLFWLRIYLFSLYC